MTSYETYDDVFYMKVSGGHVPVSELWAFLTKVAGERMIVNWHHKDECINARDIDLNALLRVRQTHVSTIPFSRLKTMRVPKPEYVEVRRGSTLTILKYLKIWTVSPPDPTMEWWMSHLGPDHKLEIHKDGIVVLLKKRTR